MRTPALALLPALVLSAQEPVDAALNARIRAEGLARSQAMPLLLELCDGFGPRLMASPSYRDAAAWAARRLEGWGLTARLEPFPFGHPGWSNARCSAHVLAPYQDPVNVEVVAWTPSTPGEVKGRALRLELPAEPLPAELDALLARQGKAVKGRIVFVGAPKPLAVLPTPQAPRLDAAELAKRFDPALAPSTRVPSRPGPSRKGALAQREVDARVDAFLVRHGALARVDDAGLRHGQIRAFANRSYDPSRAVPSVVMRREDYGRLWRLMEGGREATLALDIRNRLHPECTAGLNVVGELKGREKPDEVILLGAHFDSWHTATGATDNGCNAVTMMEALRILKALGVQPRRTLRVVLYDGEEQGLLGSQAYVQAHFGSAEAPKADFAKLVAVFNADGGAGALRGLSVFGPAEAAQVLRELLAPFHDLGAVGAGRSVVRLPKPDYTDVTAFTHAGLPGVSVIQDGLEYGAFTWHTSVDTPERVPAEDLARTATILASVAYHLAERPEPLPRFAPGSLPPLPAAPGSLPAGGGR